MSLVLSLFPGLGLFDRAFEAEGFCVVRGPDLLWGGNVRDFHPPEGLFDGVIGGPPCTPFSSSNNGNRSGSEDLIPEFCRVVDEAWPRWFVMENVLGAPMPVVEGFGVQSIVLDNRWFGGVQARRRVFSFGFHGRYLGPRWAEAIRSQQVTLESVDSAPTFTANAGRWDPVKQRSDSRRTKAMLREGLRLQGLPEDYLDHCAFTVEGAIHAVGNGVPLPMGRAVAQAVKAVISKSEAA